MNPEISPIRQFYSPPCGPLTIQDTMAEVARIIMFRIQDIKDGDFTIGNELQSQLRFRFATLNSHIYHTLINETTMPLTRIRPTRNYESFSHHSDQLEDTMIFLQGNFYNYLSTAALVYLTELMNDFLIQFRTLTDPCYNYTQ